MKNFKKQKIFYRFLLFVLPFLVLSIIMTSITLSWTSYTNFRKTIDQDYRNILKSSAGEIRLYVENAQKNLESLALVIASTKLDTWGKDMALTAFHHKSSEFVSVSLISREGKKIVTAGREEGDIDYHQSGTFMRALTGQNAISGVLLSKENLPYMHIAMPVIHLGEVKEVIWGKLNLKSVWDILEGITVGKTGQVYIMDLSGRYIAHREIDRVVMTPPAEKPSILEDLRETDTPTGWIEEKDGTRFYCLGVYIPDHDWVIVLSQPFPEIYAYLYQNMYWAMIITALICIAAIVLGWHRVKRFLTPIHTLHRQVQRIGQGDLDQKVSVDSHDEIGDLGLAFNEMTDSLKNYIRREVETAKELVHAKNLAVLGTTSSKVTHEVGNLLNNVGMTLSTLQGEALSQRGEKALQILEKEALRVRKFIYNFLQFAKKPELRLQKIPLDALIQEVLAINQPDAEKRGIDLQLEWPSHLPPVNVDTRLIYQAVNNLLKNSLEAMTDPGTIRIKGEIEGDHLLVTMEDTGPGIEAKVLERIFDPFFTTKGKKGTGLGMSIVKTIVESHRGSIEYKSDAKKGATFILRLPLQ
jgi:signal transduction histidine kinase